MPTYQRREVVCDAVRAITAIDYPGSVELIIIVDGSTDGTEAALAEIDCPFPTRIIFQNNAGLAAARNRGAAEASGEVILFLDDDMICRPDVLNHHAGSVRNGADAVLGHIPLDPRSPDTFLAAAAGKWADDRADKLRAGTPLTLFDLIGGHMSIRRSVFAAAGGFDAGFTHQGTYGDEDLDLGVRLVDDYNVVFNPDAVAYQRYVVTPSEYLRQWMEAGWADVRFARKHPQRANELFSLHGSETLTSRLILRPIAASDTLSRASRAAALWLAEQEKVLREPLRRMVPHFFRLARDIAYWSGVRQAGGIPCASEVLVLCYHAIADLTGDPILAEYGIAPENFISQLDGLLARGFHFVTPDELLRTIEGTSGVPRKAVLLTFDDCYEELADVACSVLQPRGIEAIAFAVTGMASGTNEWDQSIGARTLRLLKANGLRELRRCGIEVGGHSRSHRPLDSVNDEELAAETIGCADDIAALGISHPRFFAYPHGSHDFSARAAARVAGFTAAFGLASRRASASSDRFAIPRVEILARDAGWRFWLKTSLPALAPLTRLRSVLAGRAYGLIKTLRRLFEWSAGSRSTPETSRRKRRTKRPTTG